MLKVFHLLNMSTVQESPLLPYLNSPQRVYTHPTYLLLALSHSQELESVSPVAHPVGQLAQVPSWVCPRAQDEDNRRVRGGLVIDTVEADHRGCDILLPHPPRHEVGDGSVDPIHTEASQQQQLLKVTEAIRVAAREGDGLGGIFVKPLHGEEEGGEGSVRGKGEERDQLLHPYVRMYMCVHS